MSSQNCGILPSETSRDAVDHHMAAPSILPTQPTPAGPMQVVRTNGPPATAVKWPRLIGMPSEQLGAKKRANTIDGNPAPQDVSHKRKESSPLSSSRDMVSRATWPPTAPKRSKRKAGHDVSPTRQDIRHGQGDQVSSDVTCTAPHELTSTVDRQASCTRHSLIFSAATKPRVEDPGARNY